MQEPLVITTERLHLIPRWPGESVLDKMQLGWLNDPEVVKYSEQRHVKHTLASVRKYVASFDNERNHLLGIYRKGHHNTAADLYIGNISVHRDLPNGVAEVGILIGEKREWGKGYGKEAWKATCDWALSNSAIRKVEAGCMAANHHMVRVLNKTMQFEGVRYDHFMFNGKPVDMAMYERFK